MFSYFAVWAWGAGSKGEEVPRPSPPK